MLKLFLLMSVICGMSTQSIDKINADFYNNSNHTFDQIPFKEILPSLLLNYCQGRQLLEIGSGPGALALWLQKNGYNVTCLEPAENLAELAIEKGLNVHTSTIQKFNADRKFDAIVAISSLIHVPKKELPHQIEKIANMLTADGTLFVSFIQGENEGLDDPTRSGKFRYFSYWKEEEIETLLSPYFDLVEKDQIYNQKMNRTFLLEVYRLKSRW